jgi:hypothetical protein
MIEIFNCKKFCLYISTSWKWGFDVYCGGVIIALGFVCIFFWHY